MDKRDTCFMCQQPSEVLVRHNHPEAYLRWEYELCRNCMKEAEKRPGTGAFSYFPLPKSKEVQDEYAFRV